MSDDSRPLSSATLRWSCALPGAIGHPVPVRTAGGVQGIVVTLAEGAVVLVDAAGKERWRARLDLAADAGAACGILKPGSPPAIVVTDVWASVYCFSSDGRRMWKLPRESRSGGFRTPVIADLDGDGVREIIVTDSRGRLLCISADGKPRLEVTAGNYRVSAPAVCSVGDGPRHLIFGNDAGDVYRITADGRLLWACRPGGRFGRSLPVVVQRPAGAAVLLGTSFVSAEPGLMMLDAATGAFLGRSASEVQTYQSTAVMEPPGHGRPAIIFGDKNSVVYALDAGGSRLWATRLEGRGIFHAPAVMASGADTLIVQTVRGSGPNGHCVYALDGNGRILDSIGLPGGGSSSPIACRFAGEPMLSLVTVSANGTLERRDLPEPWTHANVAWTGPPDGRVWKAASPQRERTHVRTLGERPAVLGRNTMEAVAPDDTDYAGIRTVSGGLIRTTLLRLGDTGAQRSAVANVRADTVGRHFVDVAWHASDRSRPILEERLAFTVDPRLTTDAKQQALFDRSLAEAVRRDPSHQEILDYLRRSCRSQYEAARAARSAQAFDALRRERERCLALVHLARRVRGGEELVALQVADPWKPFDPIQAVGAEGPLNEVRLDMLGNERESCALAVANLSARTMSVRVERGSLRPQDIPDKLVPGAQVIRLHEPISVTPTTTGQPGEDPLPELGDASTLRLAPGEVRMLWLTVSTADLAAGEYTGVLRLGDTASTRSPIEVRMTIRVSSVRLPDRLRYRHCNWLSPASWLDETVREAVIQDALDHGTSVFVIAPPTVRLNADGSAAAVDGPMHDRLARRLQGRAFLLITGAPSLAWPSDAPANDTVRDAGFAAAIRAYGEHMRSLGWANRDYALYLQDEPGLSGPNHEFEAFVAQVRRVKAADPAMLIYANPAGGATAAMLERLKDLVDVWCPDMHLYRADPARLEPIFRAGKEWWHYEAPGDQRNLSPLGFYRMQAWVAFRHGMQGAGYWVHSYDPYWFVTPGQGSEYGSVYMTDGIPIATKRWEATRDGIEDYELLSMLRDAVLADRGQWSEEARLLLDKAVAFVTDGQEHASDIGRQTEPFEPACGEWTARRTALIRMLETRPLHDGAAHQQVRGH